MQAVRIVSVVGVVAALAAAFWLMAPAGGPAKPSQQPSSQPETKRARPNGPPVVFGVIPAIDDRFGPEPCNRVLGGGLLSLGAFMADVREQFPAAIGISLGDLTLAPGGIGRATARHHFGEVFPHTGVEYVAAGDGELALGTTFVREVLTRIEGVTLICANAADANGQPILRGWVLLKSGERGVLIVAVAADSLDVDLRRRGSDVRLLSAEKSAAVAKSEGLEQAARTGVDVDVIALIVHGTVDEAAAIVEKTPGVTFAAAAHGGVMADPEPRIVRGVPILYGGQGLRFGWRILVPGNGEAPTTSLARVGRQYFAKGSTYGDTIAFFRELATKSLFAQSVATIGDRPLDPRGRYVGGRRCADCHQDVASQHAASAHGKPSAAIIDSTFGASTGCISCHTTGAWWDTGWTGPPDRSEMAAVSCEACHGPGADHSAAPTKKGYGRVPFSRCGDCHLPDRSPSFDAEAAWKRGGHSLK